jgi:ABC-type transport system involved in multi-copper enzyme maturation permease subunit
MLNFVPVVHRELRVAARRPVTYYSRLAAGVTAGSLCIGLVFFGFAGLVALVSMAQAVFVTLAIVGFLYALAIGVWQTADSLSSEKRNDTLGLLFLTSLDGFDIVVGKLVACGLAPFYSLLAAFPAPAIALFLGGLTLADYFRMMMVLANTLFFSLALGLLISSLCRRARSAFLAGLAAMLVLAVLAPVAAGITFSITGSQPVPTDLTYWPIACLCVSPVAPLWVGLEQVLNPSSPAVPIGFWQSWFGVHLLSWIMLLLAGQILPRTWQQRATTGAVGKSRAALTRWWAELGSLARWRPARERFAEATPALWLAQRRQPLSLFALASFLVVGAGTVLAAAVASTHGNPTPLFIVGLAVLHFLLKLEVAIQASRALAEDRNSGALELLLTTPLGEDEIVRGHLLALKRRFLGPMLLLVAADFLVWLSLWIAKVPVPWELAGYSAMAVGLFITFQLADMYVMSWWGLWVGLTSPSAAQALTRNIGAVLVRPWIYFFVGWATLAALTRGRMVDHPAGALFLLLFWVISVCCVNTGLCARAVSCLRDDFRAAAAQIIAPPGLSLRGRWQRLLKGLKLQRALLCALLPWLAAGQGLALDLGQAVVVSPPNSSVPEKTAVLMLVEEVARRTQLTWASRSAWPTDDRPVIAVGSRSALAAWGGDRTKGLSPIPPTLPPEGFEVRTVAAEAGAGPVVLVAGNDARGVLFGVGYLLRHLRLGQGAVSLAEDLQIVTAPRYPLRGHQLGYRPKTHSYDAWDLPTWEQYIRDLAVFGCNAVELIPPRSDDDASSPHFPLPPMRMLVEMSRLLDRYGLDVWLWYPALDRDYSDPKTVEFALQEWGEVFKQVPRLDAVFVPGGDPGHTQPKVLMNLLQKQTDGLHRHHPKAQMWVSPQGFTQAWLDEFLQILRTEQPRWLSGVVFGPQVRISLPALRTAVPAQYPIRHYPDITHSRQCQYPVPDWDTAFALTMAREGINPRPTSQAAIFRLLQPHTVGFITYSEGCNDDVNKTIWSALGWNPEAEATEILRQYSRYFLGERYTDDFAQGLLALERDWQGPLLANAGVETTLRQFQTMERLATPRDQVNWRFQMALYRAYYDAYTRSRLLYETELEDRAMTALRQARRLGSLNAMTQATAILDRARTERVAPDWRARVFELAEALFQSIRMQLSVERYQAIAVDRGASLDTLDYPLNNRLWLEERFRALRAKPTEADRRAGIEEILNWTNPGPGGFYDDLGNLACQPHLTRGLGYERDPAFLASSLVGFEEGDVVDEPDERPEGALRFSWINHAESLNDAPLELHYEGLDPDARYRLRVVYAGDSPKRRIRLTTADGIEIHALITKPWPIRPVEFEVPPGATAKGQLTLRWYREAGLGGNGRGCQVSEVWLLKAR